MQILKTKPYSFPLSALDVPSSPRPPWWQSVPGQVALSAGAFLLVLFARRPETFLNPQLWAEDGSIFFVQADEFGARALTFSWADYHHFLLRLIAVVSSPLNAQLVPAAYVGISLLVLLAVVLALFSPRLDLPARPACALALVLIPHTGEAIGNLTNLQWVCGLGLVWLLLARDASTMRQHVTDGIIALVFGLTGTFSILFAPLFTWRAWRRRTAASLVLAVLVVITAGVQLWTIAHSPPHPSGQENLTVEAVAWWLGFRLPAALFLPGDWAVRAPRGVLEVLGVLTVATLLVTAFLPGRHRERRVLLVAALAAVIAATIFRMRHELTAFTRLNDGDRYLFIPKVLVAWADLRLVAGGLDSVEHAHGVRPTPSHNRDALALRTPAGPALAGLRAPDRGGRARRRHQGEPGRDLQPPRPASQMKAWVTGTALFVTCGSSFGGFQLKLCQNVEA